MVKGNGLAPRWRKSRLAPFDTRLSGLHSNTEISSARAIGRVLTTFADESRRLRMKSSGLYTLLIIVISLFTLVGQSSAQCALVCKNNLNVYYNSDGFVKLIPELLLTQQVGCSGGYTINATDTLSNSYGDNLPANLLGRKLTATVTNTASGNSCSTNIQLLDNEGPKIGGPDTVIIWCNQPFSKTAIGSPTISDNTTPSGSITVNSTDEFTDLPCMSTVGSVVVAASVKRTWTATDASGNKSTRVQNIYLRRATLDMVVFPKHRDGVQAPTLECSVDNPLNLNLTGQPMVENTKLDITTHCDLITSSNDQSIPICGGSKRIIRTWTVFDLCTNDFRVFSQVIIVNDSRKPTLTCPSNVKVSTLNTSCSANVTLPQATASDACSGVVVTPNWQFGSGYGPFSNVPAGTHTVAYTAKDGCNNTSTCEITVTVTDESKPTAICQSLVTVSLQNDGKARIYATSYNNGSHDNCGIDFYRVSRDNGAYSEHLDFDCSDLNKTIPVRLKIVDKSGQESFCNSNTTVRDDVKPVITCPATVTVNCGTNYNNPAQTGIPVATDNCSIQSTTYTNAVNLNACGIGTVRRTWTAVDGSGNSSTCQQTINVVDNTTITIEFPKDILTYQCNPNLDTSVTGIPKVIGRDCEQLQVTSTDYFFYTAQPACFKLLRKWAVINWCVFQPNDPSKGGFWEHTQVIEVRDTIAPVLTCPTNLMVEIQSAQCEAFVNVPLPTVNDCSKAMTFTNISAYASSKSGSASGTYPIGTHNITYLASDGCGNSASCKTMVTVKDAQAPKPVCNNGVTVTIQPNGTVTLTPSMINGGSTDNCSQVSKLILQVSPNTFTCQGLGNKTVTLTVTDESGNSGFCSTTVVVQDNFGVCASQSSVTIAGKIAREGGDPASQKPVTLSGAISINAFTGVDGTFAFPNLPLGKTYTITPSANTQVLNGVTTLDMVIIRRHILGIEHLATPYKVIAADVNKSGSVTTFDLVELQKLILNISTKFPNNTPSWRFVDATFEFPNPKNPFSPGIPESITVTNVVANQWNKNFIAIKVGDVNDSAIPTNLNENTTEDRSFEGHLDFYINDVLLEAGREHLVSMKAGDFKNIAGFQFTLGFDSKALSYEGFEETALQNFNHNNIGTTLTADGYLALSWDNANGQIFKDGENLIVFRFKALKKVRLSEVLSLSSKVTAAEAYSGSATAKNADFGLLRPVLNFENTAREGIHIYPNSPNPFYQSTLIRFYLPEATGVQLKVYDVYGRLLKTQVGNYSKGTHEMQLDMSGCGAKGILIAELEANGYQRKTLRMLMMSD